MSYPGLSNCGYKESPHEYTMNEVAGEVRRAREKFPHADHLLAALMEEVGELAEKLLQLGPGEIDSEARRLVRKEAMQVAAVAVRIMEEGDPKFLDLPASARQLGEEQLQETQASLAEAGHRSGFVTCPACGTVGRRTDVSGIVIPGSVVYECERCPRSWEVLAS